MLVLPLTFLDWEFASLQTPEGISWRKSRMDLREETVALRGKIMDLFILLQKNYLTFFGHDLDNKQEHRAQ